MNVLALRSRIIRAIEIAPVEIDLIRPVLEDDGCGGYFVSSEDNYATVKGVLDNSSGGVGAITEKPSLGGISYKTRAPIFYTLYEDCFNISKGDYFIANGIKYTITNPVNILNQNICWQLSLEAEIYKEG